MIVQESRILQVCIFETIQRNLAVVDFSSVLPDIMLLADEVDSQLTQSIDSSENAKVHDSVEPSDPVLQNLNVTRGFTNSKGDELGLSLNLPTPSSTSAEPEDSSACTDWSVREHRYGMLLATYSQLVVSENISPVELRKAPWA
jgi:hypothetical protein